MNPLLKGVLFGGLAGLVTTGIVFAADLGNLTTLILSTQLSAVAAAVMTFKFVATFAVGGLITGSTVGSDAIRVRSRTGAPALAQSYQSGDPP